MEHTPLPMQTKLSAKSQPLYRIPCSCGWVGCWFASGAPESWVRHSTRDARRSAARREADQARRDLGLTKTPYGWE